MPFEHGRNGYIIHDSAEPTLHWRLPEAAPSAALQVVHGVQSGCETAVVGCKAAVCVA